MKIKVIDLLIKIANREEVPKKIKWENIIYAYSEYDKDYLEYPFSNEEYKGLFDMRDNILTQFLNDEVEIIKEPKKIKKIEIYEDSNGHYFYDKHCKKIYITCDEINFMFEQFNELIDEINNIKENEHEI